eukprot:2940617-Rhodomonas_salina.1
MFLDHKYLYYDVDPFLFYVVCECDSQVRDQLSFSAPPYDLVGMLLRVRDSSGRVGAYQALYARCSTELGYGLPGQGEGVRERLQSRVHSNAPPAPGHAPYHVPSSLCPPYAISGADVA